MIWRAIERIDPVAVFGRPWSSLSARERLDLLNYDAIRTREDRPAPPKPSPTTTKKKRG